MKWNKAKLRDFCDFRHGGTPSKARSDFWGGHIPWVSPKDMRNPIIQDTEDHITQIAVDEDGAVMTPPNSLLVVVRSGILVRSFPVARTAIETSFNQDMKAIRVDSSMALPEFVRRFLQAREKQILIQGVKRGATVHSIQSGYIESLEMPLPAPREQRRIVELLEQADGLRRQRAEGDQKAARILPAIFHKMFGEPATNPKNWPMADGSKIFAEIRYGVGTPPPFAQSGIPFLRAGNIDHGTFIKKDLVFFAPEFESSIDRSHVSTGDVVIVRRGAYTGDCAVVPPEFDGAYVGYDLICVPSETTNPDWFCNAFLYPTVWQRVDNMRSRAAQQGLNKEQILSFSLPYPPKPLQDKFSEFAKRVRRHQKQAEESKSNLETLFATMLHRAFTGELTAMWREAHLKELLAEMEQRPKLLHAAGKHENEGTHG
jgi:type I restriction enzyme S subunit